MKPEFKRNCPKCHSELFYSSKQKMNRANESNSLCRVCSGSIRSEKIKTYTHNNTSKQCPECASIINFTNKYKYERSIKNNSLCRPCSKKGKLNPMFGKQPINIGVKHTSETKQKMRVSTINYIEKIKLNGGQISPNYNLNSISIIEQKAKELGIFDLQHAENGGEYYIKELGYWIDGYSKEKNVVIEYDEKHHFDETGNLRERDVVRQAEIEKLLGCKFIRIKE